MDRPAVNEILPFLHLGSYKLYQDPGAEFFSKHNVALIINCTKEEKLSTPYNIAAQTPLTVRLSVLDNNSDAERMLDALPGLADLIHCYVSNSKHVLVHCEHGLQRSPTVVVAYFRKHRKDLYMPQEITKHWTKQDYLDKSIEFVKQNRPEIFGESKPGSEYMNFRRAMTAFDKDLYNERDLEIAPHMLNVEIAGRSKIQNEQVQLWAHNRQLQQELTLLQTSLAQEQDMLNRLAGRQDDFEEQSKESSEALLGRIQCNMQESKAMVAELEEQASASAKQLAAKQQELAEYEQLAQESTVRVAELGEQASASAKQLAAKQQELAECQQLAQASAGAAQMADARVALLEAKVAALQSKEQEAAAVQSTAQADTAKLHPWSPAMAALFIDPPRLTQGSLMGVNSSGGHTYSGTYRRTESSQPVKVALKMLVLPSQAGMAAFEEQVQTLWHISADSHHICRVYGVSCLDKQACVVMKLYPHSLVNKMMSASGDRRKLPIQLVIQWGIDICQGLQDLHAAGIIMRNLKQANVLVTSSGTAVLADFGLPQLDGVSRHFKSEYKLPELSCGHIAITDKADMHALGCLLVEMCTGEPSDTGALTLKVFHPQAEATPSPLVHIMQRCLCVAPERRPTAAEVQQELEALQAEARQSVQQVATGSSMDRSNSESPAGGTLRIIPV